ncbi:MAG: TIGR00269 family protein [Thermoproteota archaeon]|nr:TIGR00269 family protein [Thermoproteota archaeon]
MRSIESKAAKTISRYSMIEYGDKVAVGVSGGKDSLSLLYVLKMLFDQHSNNDNELIAVTIDEGIDGYRDESLQIVKDFCAQLHIKREILSYQSLFGIDMDQAMIQRSSQKISSCSICGTFRRRAMDIAAETVEADIVATAHNMDDQLQTFMINLLAGDVERIGWIHPEPVQFTQAGLKKIKPFVEIYEYEIAFYALQREIPFQSEDCPYMNESIRTDLREFFNRLEKDHPGIKYNAYRSMTKISKVLRNSISPPETKKCSRCGRVSTGDICSVCRMLSIL